MILVPLHAKFIWQRSREPAYCIPGLCKAGESTVSQFLLQAQTVNRRKEPWTIDSFAQPAIDKRLLGASQSHHSDVFDCFWVTAGCRFKEIETSDTRNAYVVDRHQECLCCRQNTLHTKEVAASPVHSDRWKRVSRWCISLLWPSGKLNFCPGRVCITDIK